MPAKKKKSLVKKVNPDSPKFDISDSKNPQGSLSKEYTRQFYWIIGVLFVLVLVFFGTYTYFQSLSHFSYQGLSFTKEKLGTIPIYHYYYYFPTADGAQKQFNLFLREDPRRNPVNVEGSISFPTSKKIYFSLAAKDFASCSKATGSVASLVSFLMGHEYKVLSGTPQESEAISKNITFVNCYTHPSQTVILITNSTESKISLENRCYNLEVANCDILSVVEKFMVQSLIDSRNQAIKSNTLMTVTPSSQEGKLIALPANSTKLYNVSK